MNAMINVRTDAEVKKKAETIFEDLGMSISTAINVFLRTVIREKGIPFTLNAESPNRKTKLAFEEGEKLVKNPNSKKYHTVKELRDDLDV